MPRGRQGVTITAQIKVDVRTLVFGFTHGDAMEGAQHPEERMPEEHSWR